MSNHDKLNLQSKISHAEEVFWQDVVGDIVILDMEQGQYFGAEDTGARIWKLIEQPITVAHLCDQLLALYEIDRKTCETEVLAYLEQLLAAKLIVISSA